MIAPKTTGRIQVVACLVLLWLAAFGASPDLSAASRLDTDIQAIDGQWLIRIAAGEDPIGLAASVGAVYVGPLRGVDGYHRVKFARPLASRDPADWRAGLVRKLESDRRITAFEEEQLFTRYPRAYTPPDPRFPEQWHLENAGQSGGIPFSDVNVRPVWDTGINGLGVTIAVVDEGTEYTHPDLFPNYLAGSGYDFNDDDSDPSPGDATDRHGTAVAGISLAASNTRGGLGIAYRSKLVPLRLIAGPYASGEEAEALSFHKRGWNIQVYNNSWGPSDDAGVRYADSSQVLKDALADNVQTGRGGLGIIYVWAAGNGGLNGDNSNYDGYNSLPYTISVGALGHDDIKQGYSEPGANLLVMAPSGGRGAGIWTTDNTGSAGYASGDEYDNFNGTSAAAPMVSGVVALMLQQRPVLNWRDVQQLLARTAVPVDFANGEWTRNGAGLWTSHDYGFGRVDAAAAVQAAKDWPVLPALQTLPAQQIRGLSLPYATTREGSITIATDIEVQLVRVTLRLNHSNWGDIRVELISPSGTSSVLAEPHPNANSSYAPGTWTYLSTRHLGESSAGTWRLRVTDDGTAGTGTWTDWSIQVLGHDLSTRSNRLPTGEDLVIESTQYPVEFDALAGMSDPDGDPLQVISIQYPRSGTLVPLGGTRFQFTMGQSESGAETFSLLFSDGRGGLKRRLVRVLDPRPVGRNDLFPVRAGQTAELPVLANDIDPDGDPLRLTSLGGSYPGTASINGTRISYTPPAGFAGVARISYQLTDDSDGVSTGWATVVSQVQPDIAVQFDGEDDHLLLRPTTQVNTRDDFTAEAWIYPESYGEYVTGFGRIFDRDTFVFFLNGFDHTFYNDRSLVVYLILSDGRQVAVNSAANVISLNTWQHVAVSFDSGNLSAPVRLYVNGNPVTLSYPADVSTGPPLLPIWDNSGFDLYIGESDSGARAFKGRMSELRIWDSVVPPATIKSQSTRRLTGLETGLRLYLPLDRTLEPFAISTGTFTGTVEMFGASRVPLDLPWAALENHYTLIEDTGSGWWRERTLGWLYGDAFPWIYLPSLEWVYTGQGPGRTQYILYPVNNNWGWLQSSPAVYPWFYRYKTDSWLWYFDGTSDPAYFFDYASSDWVSGRDNVPGS